jgi:hypothetical protein
MAGFPNSGTEAQDIFIGSILPLGEFQLLLQRNPSQSFRSFNIIIVCSNVEDSMHVSISLRRFSLLTLSA